MLTSGMDAPSPASAALRLRGIKILHTVVWALFAGAIVVTPLFAWRGDYVVAWGLVLLVLGEVLVLVLNGWRCPLTDVAAGFTDDRRDNFDIYLPEAIARHNKSIFGALYVLAILFTAARQLGWLGGHR